MAHQQALKIRQKRTEKRQAKQPTNKNRQRKKPNLYPSSAHCEHMLCNVQKYRYGEIVYTFFTPSVASIRLLVFSFMKMHCESDDGSNGRMWAIARTHAFPTKPTTNSAALHICNFCEMRCSIATTLKRGFLFIFVSHLSYNEYRVDLLFFVCIIALLFGALVGRMFMLECVRACVFFFSRSHAIQMVSIKYRELFVRFSLSTRGIVGTRRSTFPISFIARCRINAVIEQHTPKWFS